MYRYVRVGLACFKFIVPARSFHFFSFLFLSPKDLKFRSRCRCKITARTAVQSAELTTLRFENFWSISIKLGTWDSQALVRRRGFTR